MKKIKLISILILLTGVFIIQLSFVSASPDISSGGSGDSGGSAGPDIPSDGSTGPDIPDSGSTGPDIPDGGLGGPDIPGDSPEGPDIPDGGLEGPDIPSDSPEGPDIPSDTPEGPDIPDDGSEGPDIPEDAPDVPDAPGEPEEPFIPLPTVDIKANDSDGPIDIAYNTAATLTWTSSNANSCSASGDWSGAKAVSGSESTGNLTSAKTYTITCTGAGGSAVDSVTVNVGAEPVTPPASPTVDIKANNSDGPITISYNTAAALAWVSANADSCTASEDWSGTKSLSGSQSTGNLTSAKTYTITCTGSGGSAFDSVTVNVGPRPYSRGGSSSTITSSRQTPTIYIKKTVRNVSQGTVFSDLLYANPGESLVFGIVVKAGNNSLSQVIVKDILPEGLIYQGGLTVDDASVEGDISTGLNIGDFSADQSKTIIFQVKVAEAAMFSFGENKIINTALALQDSVSAEDTAEIIILKGEVAGAATEISTGLTNNIFLDSFFLPLVLTCLIIWLIKSHIIKFEEWLDLRRKQYRIYKSRKTLQLKIARIKTKEFFGRII
jgi:uncharacterized repeat protein (TIGR01451 family)